MPIFQTGDGSSEITTNVGLELIEEVWFKSALIQALSLMCNDANWTVQGSATIGFARDKSVEMLNSLQIGVPLVQVGTIVMFAADAEPEGWLICDGGIYDTADYPELYALIGDTFGVAGTGEFKVPDFRNRSPYGAHIPNIEVGEKAGSETHILTEAEIPAHTHTTPQGFQGAGTRASATGGAGLATVSGSTGGGGAHNNLHPVMGITFLIYAGG